MADAPNITQNLLDMYGPNHWTTRLNLYFFLRISGVLDLPRDTKVLDCGCAMGNLIRVLRSYGFTDIKGVDNAPEMVEAARRLTNVPIILSDVLDIDKHIVEHGTYDVVIISNIIHHLPSTDAWRNLLGSCHKILKENGYLVIREPWLTIPMKSLYHISQYEVLHRGFMREHLRSFHEEKELLEYFFAHWPREYKSLLADSGFIVSKDMNWLVHRITRCQKMASSE